MTSRSPSDRLPSTPQAAPAAQAPLAGAPPQLVELAKTLANLTQAHRDLLAALEVQHTAMTKFDTLTMTDSARRQESIGRRIMKLEQERRRWVQLLARPLGLPSDASLVQIAAAHPEHREQLMALRNELRRTTAQAAARSHTCGRIAGSVLSHLNSALRLITEATTYRRTGSFDVPPPKPRMEAVA